MTSLSDKLFKCKKCLFRGGIILIDHFTQFLPRDKEGYPHSVKSHLKSEIVNLYKSWDTFLLDGCEMILPISLFARSWTCLIWLFFMTFRTKLLNARYAQNYENHKITKIDESKFKHDLANHRSGISVGQNLNAAKFNKLKTDLQAYLPIMTHEYSGRML